MKIKVTLIIIIVVLSHSSFSQDLEEKRGRPNLPGTFLLEFGFNIPQGTPEKFDAAFWGSRSINIYYQHDIVLPILENKFSLSPGIGLGLERFKITSENTLAFENGDLVMSKINLDITKSLFITNYFDIPIELKFTNRPDDPSRSFKVAVGAKGGLLLGGYTKITYDDEDQGKIKDKSKRDWNLNPYRYGVYGKIGFGSIYLFGSYSLSTMFKKGEGPDGSSINNLSVGISWAAF